jgi:hypothetical protein
LKREILTVWKGLDEHNDSLLMSKPTIFATEILINGSSKNKLHNQKLCKSIVIVIENEI